MSQEHKCSWDIFECSFSFKKTPSLTKSATKRQILCFYFIISLSDPHKCRQRESNTNYFIEQQPPLNHVKLSLIGVLQNAGDNGSG